MFRGPAGHALPGRVPDPSTLHLSLDRSTIPAGRIYFAFPDPDSYENGRKEDRQTGAPDVANWFLLWTVHSARRGITGLLVLRVLQL